MCVCVGSLLPLMGPDIISFLSLRPGNIVVIYMAQVQPDSNMSDICYYSEIFPPPGWSGGPPCNRGWKRYTWLIDPPAGYQSPQEKSPFMLTTQTDESRGAWIIWETEITTSPFFSHRCWKWYSQLSKKYRSQRQPVRKKWENKRGQRERGRRMW